MGNPLEWNERLTGQEDLQLFLSAGYIYSQNAKLKKYIAIIRPKFRKPIARYLNMVQVGDQKYRGMLLEIVFSILSL
jgi:hypothetical protein